MFRVLDSTNRDEWNKIVKSFKNWDIYFLWEYANSFFIHGDGEAYLFYYENSNDRLCFVGTKKDLYNNPKFEQKLEKGKYFDLDTPYGYGGVLLDNDINKESQVDFKNQFDEYCRNNSIVSVFFRYHPLLDNYGKLDYFEDYFIHDTIYMDTTSEEIINTNLDSKNRNVIRKAIKNGVEIVIKPISEYQDFIGLYNGTMEKLNASYYYIFKDEYYKSLGELKDNANIFYAYYEGKPIAASIMLFNEQYMHYHLSGSDIEYRNLPATNLLLFEAAKWASNRGIKKFHLGGGLSADDSLFGFKKQFNKNDRVKFYLGKYIANKEAYDYLVNLRKELDPSFDVNNTNLIQYRK